MPKNHIVCHSSQLLCSLDEHWWCYNTRPARTGCCIEWLRWAGGGSACSPRWRRGTKRIWRWRWRCRAPTACPQIGCPAPASCWCDWRTGGHRASSAAGTRSWCNPANKHAMQTCRLSQGRGWNTGIKTPTLQRYGGEKRNKTHSLWRIFCEMKQSPVCVDWGLHLHTSIQIKLKLWSIIREVKRWSCVISWFCLVSSVGPACICWSKENVYLCGKESGPHAYRASARFASFHPKSLVEYRMI